ncbi:phosphonate ABC transporter, permease protein PhnE [Caulobacter sp. KR2-114]|uniref:phosphonate ABC transporter, permease protein PhnE n=1 Tax=Caulobacter sp. KR2-114 TaxID=3400912 RepID=UPI003C04122A
MAAADPGAPLAPPRKPLSAQALDWVIWGGVAAILLLSFRSAEVEKFGALFAGSDNMQRFGAEFIRPNFGQIGDYVAKMWLTIQMALWGTFLAIIVAIPMGLAGAKNVAPAWLQFPVRRVLDVLRAVPDLVVGSIFVAAVGLGPFAGVMAIAVNTGGVLGKLFAEAVESIERGPVEGVRATGATPLHEIVWAVIPQVAPLWTSYALYRFESSARSATVLGLIGAGGIGQAMFDSINSYSFDQTSAIVIVIAVAVSGIDLLSQVIRGRLL